MEKIIALGAEAVLIERDGELVKKRIRKSYRHEKLDEQLRKTRTRKEAKLFSKATGLIDVPKIIRVDEKTKEIAMEFIAGKKLSEHLDKLNVEEATVVCKEIGKNIALLHDADIVHGDLTTSNMILHKNKVFFIDFGLGFESSRIEDKAVDLHLLRQAFESKHYEKWQEYFNSALEGYKISKKSSDVLRQLKRVESRGRYKGKH
jgi:Kae1-associated kinase Bud32